MHRPPRPLPPARDLAGLVRLRRDLLADGMSDTQIDCLVRVGALHRVRYGAYVTRDVWESCTPEDRHRLRARAVLARAHEETVLTHTSSLVERGVPLWGVPIAVVHTTRGAPERAGRRQDDWVPHRGLLRPADVEELNGVRISTAARSAFELTTVVGVEAGLVAVNRLLHAGEMTVTDFEAEMQEHACWPGKLTANIVVHLADGRLESVGEDRFSYLVHRQGLPRPEPQHEVFDEHGTLVAYLDFAWPEVGVFVEFDGRVKYEKHRREGESLADFVMREKKREELVCLLTGWTCIRVTWADLARPELLAARIRKVLAARGAVAS
ncbi:hypothetical protein F4692_001953 [Nocardioides cavernae]|uniref:Type IV toxin-antitoxin system AbiEi family antitoxin domain-containing protein n=1 Tax=Nocardioides cavernae TaxID=1921566 RepID=A0A7Y9KRQ5_9ACTN|nr:hypothetical protein [Nocardioides cavernae]NYE36820.1 hypothetical protein [Nocardioides cavernae]